MFFHTRMTTFVPCALLYVLYTEWGQKILSDKSHTNTEIVLCGQAYGGSVQSLFGIHDHISYRQMANWTSLKVVHASWSPF